MKVRINTTSFCFYLAVYLYAEIDFGVRMIRNGLSIDDDCVDGSGIKRTSSSARAPPTEKHNILHSFNESMEAFRHDFLLLFLRSYFNDKCPERIIACKSASNARAQTSPLAGGFPFIHSDGLENGHALYRSDITCVRSKMIFSPEFNVAISVGMHRQKPKLAHMPMNVNQYLHSITV